MSEGWLTDKQEMAAEVVELGEHLFELALATHTGTGEASEEPYPTTEMRAAAEEFFATLRVLLNLPTSH